MQHTARRQGRRGGAWWLIGAAALVACCRAAALGTLTVYQKCGLIADVESDLTQCTQVRCVSGSECDGLNAKCSKFMYCAAPGDNGNASVAGSSAAAASYSSAPLLGNGQCTAALPLGEACRDHADCVDYWAGAYCSPDTHVCTRARTLNEHCDDVARCAYPLKCRNGTCEDENTLATGEACDTALDNGGCHLSLYCDAASGQCQELPGEGKACDAEMGCSLALTCTNESQVCVHAMTRNATQPCTTALDCQDGLVCARDGVCHERPDNHTSTPECKSQADCPITSYCHCDYATGATRCLPLPVSSVSVLEAFEVLVACVRLDADLSVDRCQDELLQVQRAVNASAILDSECSRIATQSSDSVDPLLLLVPVAIMAVILVLVLIVKLGAPKEK